MRMTIGMSFALAGLSASLLWVSGSLAGEGKKVPSGKALKNVGPTLAKVYTFEPFHPAMPDHLWMDTGNGRGVFLHFNKAASDPNARLIFVGEGIKSRFYAEDQPDGGVITF